MTKYICFVKSKGLFYNPAGKLVHKPVARTAYAKDKETAKLIMIGKGYDVLEILTKEELEEKVKEHEDNQTDGQ